MSASITSYPPPVGPPSPHSSPPDHPPEGETRGRLGLKRVAAMVVALAVVGVSLSFDREPVGVVIALFVLVVPFEKLFPRHRQRLRRPLVLTDLAYALASPLLTAVGIAAGVVVAVVSLAWLPGLALRPLVGALPPAAVPFLGIALFDLAIYWTHRWYHEVPFLWRFHAIHHSTEHLDWVSGFRNHPFDGTLLAPAFIFLIAAGFSPEFTGVLAIIQIVTGIFLHANVRWRWRWLHRIVITPEFHHWHHADEPVAIHSNYSVFLPAWDLLFGTYYMPADRRPSRYGVSEPIPDTMVGQLWHPLRGAGNPLRLLRHPIRSLRGLGRFVRQLLRDLRRSATRPRNTVPAMMERVAPAVAGPTAIPATIPAASPAPGAVPSPAVPPPGWPTTAPTAAPTTMPTAAPTTMPTAAPTQSWPTEPLAPTQPLPRPARNLAEAMGWDDDQRW